ncbi:MAG: hypothetical protein R3D55_03460 [Chloroflexota bacterium]
MPSIEMRFAALYSQGVRRDGSACRSGWRNAAPIPPNSWKQPKGEITVGYDADLVIFDPDATKTLTPETLHETAGWTPYAGLTLQGWPQTGTQPGQNCGAGWGICGCRRNDRFSTAQANL